MVENIAPNPDANKPSGSAIPPPPTLTSQVTIRTLPSDLELMGQGSRPTIQNAPMVAMPVRQSAEAPSSFPEGPTRKSLLGLWSMVGGVGILVLFFAGYHFLPLLLSRKSAAPSVPAASSGASSTLPAPTGPVSIAHESFFRQPADQTLAFDIAVSSPQNFAPALGIALSRGSANAAFSEILLRDANGNSPSWTRFLDMIASRLLPDQIWQDNFEPDFTAFAYKDKTGQWPGYILKLKEGKSQLVLGSQVLALENASSGLLTLFLSPPGNIAASFYDLQFAGQPARILAYRNATFIYGWAYGKYLILSTSMEGYREAVARL